MMGIMRLFLMIGISIVMMHSDILAEGPGRAVNLGAVINSEGAEFSPTFTDDGKTMVFSMMKKGSKNTHLYKSNLINGTWSEPEPFTVLNSDRDDENPFISIDGSLIVFSSNRDGGNFPKDFKGDKNQLPHDIYISYKIGNDWSIPEKISDNVNSENNERAPSISMDNNTLYFTRYSGNDPATGKIMSAQLTSSGFENVQELDKIINDGSGSYGFTPSRFREGFYFSSKRPGGSGSWDLYFVSAVKGKFLKPVNLGPEVNTPNDELSALEYDQNTLFFSSHRSDGIGLFDIFSYTVSPDFYTKLLSGDDSGRRNESKDDKDAVQTIDKKDTGFTFKFVRENQLLPLAVKLRTTLKYAADKSGKPDKIINGESTKDGNYSLLTEPGVTSVILETLGPDFLTTRKEYQVESGKIRDVKISLKIKEAGDFIIFDPADFKPIYFDYNSSQIRLEYIPYIYDLIIYLRSNRDVKIKIIGHSGITPGCDGSEKIGLKRARSVRDYITSFGIDRARLMVKSMGKKYPVDEKFNQLNRRVEFILVK